METLTDWSGAPSTIQNSVHLGTWTNWSRGKVMGATLTLERNDGNLLIAFTAVFVGLVTGRVWRIACYVFHWCYSTPKPQDTLHHQRQALLRNSGSAASAVWAFANLTLAWQNIAPRSLLRALPALLTAASCVISFAVVGGFSSQISSALKNEVLLNGTNCGVISNPIGFEGVKIINPYKSSKIAIAANYPENWLIKADRLSAQQCYQATPGILDCTHFVRNNLPTIADKRAPCPFQPSICRSNTSNIRLDTGFLNTARDLGVNAPRDESVQFRTVLHCAPLETRGYSENRTTSSGNFTVYRYGSTSNGTNFRNETYMMKSVESQYKVGEGLELEPRVEYGKNLILVSLKSVVRSRVPDLNTSTFLPIDALSRPDADLDLVFLAGNGIGYLKATEDPWYRGTIRRGGLRLTSRASQADETIPRYTPEEAASPMGCAQQHQFCNPSLPEDSRCGPLASWTDAVSGAAPLFNLTDENLDEPFSDQPNGARFLWLKQLIGHGSINLIISTLSANALASQQYMYGGNLAEMPDDQWQLDVSRWFSIHLSAIQAEVVASALGPTNPALNPYKYTPPNEHGRKICNNQKVLSTLHVSFSLFGLYFTYLTGILLIAISYIIEPISTRFCRRRNTRSEYRVLEWAATETLQLQRAGYQGMGSGTWSGHADVIPKTRPSEVLGNLPLAYRVAGLGDDDTKPQDDGLLGREGEGSFQAGPPDSSTDEYTLESAHILSLDDLLLETGSSVDEAWSFRSNSSPAHRPEDGNAGPTQVP